MPDALTGPFVSVVPHNSTDPISLNASRVIQVRRWRGDAYGPAVDGAEIVLDDGRMSPLLVHTDTSYASITSAIKTSDANDNYVEITPYGAADPVFVAADTVISVGKWVGDGPLIGTINGALIACYFGRSANFIIKTATSYSQVIALVGTIGTVFS